MKCTIFEVKDKYVLILDAEEAHIVDFDQLRELIKKCDDLIVLKP
jgi:hypothetical protein